MSAWQVLRAKGASWAALDRRVGHVGASWDSRSTVTAGYSGYNGPCVSVAHGVPAGSFSETAGVSEKVTMQELSERLTSYVEQVQSLEAANEKLEQQIQEHVERKYPSDLRELEGHLQTVDLLQAQISESQAAQAQVKLQLVGAQLEVFDLSVKCDREQERRELVEADLRDLRLVEEELKAVILPDLLSQLSSHTLQLNELHQEDVQGLLAQVSGGVAVEMQCAESSDLTQQLECLREQCTALVLKSKRQNEYWFNTQVSMLSSQEAPSPPSGSEVIRTELNELRGTSLSLEGELAQLQAQKALMENSEVDLREGYKVQLAGLQRRADGLGAELDLVLQAAEQQAAGYQALLDIKTSLEMEIEDYRRLLDGEGDGVSRSSSSSNSIASVTPLCAEINSTESKALRGYNDSVNMGRGKQGVRVEGGREHSSPVDQTSAVNTSEHIKQRQSTITSSQVPQDVHSKHTESSLLRSTDGRTQSGSLSSSTESQKQHGGREDAISADVGALVGNAKIQTMTTIENQSSSIGNWANSEEADVNTVPVGAQMNQVVDEGAMIQATAPASVSIITEITGIVPNKQTTTAVEREDQAVRESVISAQLGLTEANIQVRSQERKTEVKMDQLGKTVSAGIKGPINSETDNREFTDATGKAQWTENSGIEINTTDGKEMERPTETTCTIHQIDQAGSMGLEGPLDVETDTKETTGQPQWRMQDGIQVNAMKSTETERSNNVRISTTEASTIEKKSDTAGQAQSISQNGTQGKGTESLEINGFPSSDIHVENDGDTTERGRCRGGDIHVCAVVTDSILQTESTPHDELFSVSTESQGLRDYGGIHPSTAGHTEVNTVKDTEGERGQFSIVQSETQINAVEVGGEKDAVPNIEQSHSTTHTSSTTQVEEGKKNINAEPCISSSVYNVFTSCILNTEQNLSTESKIGLTSEATLMNREMGKEKKEIGEVEAEKGERVTGGGIHIVCVTDFEETLKITEYGVHVTQRTTEYGRQVVDSIKAFSTELDSEIDNYATDADVFNPADPELFLNQTEPELCMSPVDPGVFLSPMDPEECLSPAKGEVFWSPTDPEMCVSLDDREAYMSLTEEDEARVNLTEAVACVSPVETYVLAMKEEEQSAAFSGGQRWTEEDRTKERVMNPEGDRDDVRGHTANEIRLSSADSDCGLSMIGPKSNIRQGVGDQEKVMRPGDGFSRSNRGVREGAFSPEERYRKTSTGDREEPSSPVGRYRETSVGDRQEVVSPGDRYRKLSVGDREETTINNIGTGVWGISGAELKSSGRMTGNATSDGAGMVTSASFGGMTANTAANSGRVSGNAVANTGGRVGDTGGNGGAMAAMAGASGNTAASFGSMAYAGATVSFGGVGANSVANRGGVSGNREASNGGMTSTSGASLSGMAGNVAASSGGMVGTRSGSMAAKTQTSWGNVVKTAGDTSGVMFGTATANDGGVAGVLFSNAGSTVSGIVSGNTATNAGSGEWGVNGGRTGCMISSSISGLPSAGSDVRGLTGTAAGCRALSPVGSGRLGGGGSGKWNVYTGSTGCISSAGSGGTLNSAGSGGRLCTGASSGSRLSSSPGTHRVTSPPGNARLNSGGSGGRLSTSVSSHIRLSSSPGTHRVTSPPGNARLNSGGSGGRLSTGASSGSRLSSSSHTHRVTSPPGSVRLCSTGSGEWKPVYSATSGRMSRTGSGERPSGSSSGPNRALSQGSSGSIGASAGNGGRLSRGSGGIGSGAVSGDTISSAGSGGCSPSGTGKTNSKGGRVISSSGGPMRSTGNGAGGRMEQISVCKMAALLISAAGREKSRDRQRQPVRTQQQKAAATSPRVQCQETTGVGDTGTDDPDDLDDIARL